MDSTQNCVPAGSSGTFGRLDVIDDVLDNVPGDRHPVRILARSVSALSALPDGLDPLQDPRRVGE